MNITGNQSIATPRERVWAALNDPAILQRCLPGCESVVRTSPEQFDVVMMAAIGPLRARFNGRLLMSDVQAPASCTMNFEGQGGAVGFGKGSATVQLSDSPDGTDLRYSALAQVGGKLAQVGSRLIESVARKMANDFFEAFKAQLAPPAAPGDDPPDPASPPKPITTSDERPAAATAPSAAPPHGQARGAAARAHATPRALSTPHGQAVQVPGWWLLIAAAVGSLATLAGMALAH